MWQGPRACILPSLLPGENRGGRSGASLTVSAPCHLSAARRRPRRLLAASAAMLGRGAAAAGVADAMSEADRALGQVANLGGDASRGSAYTMDLPVGQAGERSL